MKLRTLDKTDKRQVQQFILFPFRLYWPEKGIYVPPLVKGQQKLLMGGDCMLLSGGPYDLLMAFDHDDRPVGRILVGVDEKKNRSKNLNDGYFSMFECIESKEVAALLFSGAEEWLSKRGVNRIVGPVSPTNGDDLRGILLDAFDRMPAVNTSYTKCYYPELLDVCGYQKYLDFYAYKLNGAKENYPRVKRIVERRTSRMNLTIQPFDIKNLSKEAEAIHEIFAEAARAEWEHLEVPSTAQVLDEFSSMKLFVDPDLVLIARVNDKPIGMVAAIPDYNEVLIHMNGRITPVSLIRFLILRKKIKRIRAFMQFAIPKYQGTTLMPALYIQLYENMLKKGYEVMEGSTIAEMNLSSFETLQGVGFEKTRTYRIFQKELGEFHGD